MNIPAPLPKSHTINILYWGAGISGRTTNLLYLYAYMCPEYRGKLVSVPHDEIHQLSFTFRLPEIDCMTRLHVKFKLYSSPGSVSSRKARYDDAMKADAVVFIVDSQRDRLEADKESLRELEDILVQRQYERQTFSWIIQYNKRDYLNTASIDELQHVFNRDNVPSTEAIAMQGLGVFETLNAILHKIIPETGGQVVIAKTGAPNYQQYNETLDAE